MRNLSKLLLLANCLCLLACGGAIQMTTGSPGSHDSLQGLPTGTFSFSGLACQTGAVGSKPVSDTAITYLNRFHYSMEINGSELTATEEVPGSRCNIIQHFVLHRVGTGVFAKTPVKKECSDRCTPFQCTPDPHPAPGTSLDWLRIQSDQEIRINQSSIDAYCDQTLGSNPGAWVFAKK